MDVLSATTLWTSIQDYWIVPVGMVALYFYGQFHFNTPEYTLDVETNRGSRHSTFRLVTPAPPMFTTSRARYRRYARRYVLVLEIAFLILVFCSGLVADTIRVAANTSTKLDILGALRGESLQYKALWVLFLLTGLLSSFPGFKDLDRWILSQLHRAAFIPDEVRLLAADLYNGGFRASPETLAAIKPNLTMRDPNRVAAGIATGSLEQRLIDLVSLRHQIQKATASARYTGFRVKLDRDVRELAFQTQGLREEIIAYLRDQEKLVPATATNIDEYISNGLSDPIISALSSRREELQDRCDSVYEATCLLSALSVLSTEETPESINSALHELGFQVNFQPLPLLDWDAVVRVTMSVFVLMLLMNVSFRAFTALLQIDIPALQFDRDKMVRLAVTFTVLYSAIMITGIKLKRRWRRDDVKRSENLLIGTACYSLALVVTIPFSIYIRGEMTFAPFVYGLGPAILGYFIGRYVDLRLDNQSISVTQAAWQGVTQMVAGLVASCLYPPPGMKLDTAQAFEFFAFAAIQTAVAGFLIGILFQYFYQRTRPLGSEKAEIRSRLGPERLHLVAAAPAAALMTPSGTA